MHTRIDAFASHHHEQVAQELLKAGAGVEVQNNQGWTALMYAAQNGHEQVCCSRMLSVSSVERPKHKPIHVFSSCHPEQVTRALLKANADPHQAQADGWTARVSAPLNGHEQVSSPSRPLVCTSHWRHAHA